MLLLKIKWFWLLSVLSTQNEFLSQIKILDVQSMAIKVVRSGNPDPKKAGFPEIFGLDVGSGYPKISNH